MSTVILVPYANRTSGGPTRQAAQPVFDCVETDELLRISESPFADSL